MFLYKYLCLKKESNATENLRNVRKTGVTQPKIYGVGPKVNQVIYTLVCNFMPNIRILAKAIVQIFCSQGVPIQNACVRRRGVTQPNIYEIDSKVHQFIYTLVCNFMLNITILAKAVLQIFCSQGCSYKNACVRKGEKLNRKFTE